jgi:signal transduction histidine kinase
VTTEELIDRLASHKTIGKAPRAELRWLATHGTLNHYPAGEVVLHPGEMVELLQIVLSGRLAIYVPMGGTQQRVMEWQGGDVTGLIPYSRLVTAPGNTFVEEPAESLAVHRSMFPELIRECHEVTSILVHAMLDRARRFTSADLRNEKMVSLGKLAAGLAHELNNPASAAMRDAKSLMDALVAAETAARALGSAGLTTDQLASLEHLHGLCLNGSAERALSGLALSDREEELVPWLETHGADLSIAGDLARIAVSDDTLTHLAAVLPGEGLNAALRWITAGCAARMLAMNIERAAGRIHSLVTAVKGFTHMDQAPVQGPVNIPAGLADTIALLGGKAKHRSTTISLELRPDIPSAYGLSAEINQVWMNLLDNAIDAAPEHGHVTVKAGHEGPAVVVRVIDNGAGIPADIKDRIFDPFFTTKSIGEGTGLGLDIVRRIVEWHNGEISVTSEPGRTEFRVSLPAFDPDLHGV